MTPVFKTSNVFDNGYSRVVGSNHLKLMVRQEENEHGIDAIAFQQSHQFDRIAKGLPFDICYSIEENEWNGKTSLQLNVRDIKFDFA